MELSEQVVMREIQPGVYVACARIDEYLRTKNKDLEIQRFPGFNRHMYRLKNDRRR